MVKGESASATWWVSVRGVVLPAPVSGHPALELGNTWAGWTTEGVPIAPEESASRDYLASGRHLATLATDRGLLPATWDGQVDDATVEAARELRPMAYRVARGLGSDDDLTRVSRLAAEARGLQRLARTADGLRWELRADRGTSRAPLLAAAAALADLVTSADADRVRACPGVDCGWLFLQSGRRRWCQMAVCGNRAKQATFAAKR